MPFRQLPRTDGDRLQALEAAAAKAAAVAPADLAFSAATKTALDATLPQFRTEMQQRGTAVGAQVAATAALAAQRDRLRLWTSHFFQNLNFGVARGAFPAANRAFYQLAASQESLPSLVREADLLMWSQRAVDGEAARVAAGGTAMPFPTSGEVGAERAVYVTLQADQSNKLDAATAEQEDIDALRESVDDLIEDIWDEVEFIFRKDSPPSLRAKAREYGVVYATRPNEPPDPNQPPAAPAAPTLTEANPGDVTIDWAAVVGATSYRVDKLLVGVDTDFVAFSTLTANTALIGGLAGGATLQVRIVAINANGNSPPSPVAEITLAE